MNRCKTSPPSRQRQLGWLSKYMAFAGGGLALLAALALVLGERGRGPLPSFLEGMGTGILAALPFFFAVMTLRMYQKMDEYARQQLLQAAGLAFMLTMIVSGGLIAFQAALKFSTPAWMFYVIGMGSWLVATLAQNARAGRGEA